MSFTTTLDNAQQNLLKRLKSELLQRHSLPVSDDWLIPFIISSRPPIPPLSALTSTAVFRLLATDFTKTLNTTNLTSHQATELVFPRDITNVQIKSRSLAGNVPVQVLDIEDIGSSRWNQIETIERTERGEEVRGREVIRTIPVSNDEEVNNSGSGPMSTATTHSVQNATKRSSGPHKLLLQDAAGTTIYAFEMIKVPKICIVQDTTETSEGGCGLSIGSKMVLKQGTTLRRGMIMLKPETVIVLGGKIQVWDEQWRVSRKRRLMDAISTAAGEDASRRRIQSSEERN